MAIETAPRTGTTTWQIDPGHSTLEFQAKHLMFTTVRGRFTRFSGTITLDDNDLTRSSVTVEIDPTSLTTNNEQRDGHLRSTDFLDTANHPRMTFVSSRIVRKGENRYDVVGTLMIRGISREVVLDATYNGRLRTPFNTEVAAFDARTTISRKDFGSTWNVALEAGGLLVSDEVRLMIDVEAVRQG
jgi:polyisoprenoid-binding protein YceI